MTGRTADPIKSRKEISHFADDLMTRTDFAPLFAALLAFLAGPALADSGLPVPRFVTVTDEDFALGPRPALPLRVERALESAPPGAIELRGVDFPARRPRKIRRLAGIETKQLRPRVGRTERDRSLDQERPAPADLREACELPSARLRLVGLGAAETGRRRR